MDEHEPTKEELDEKRLLEKLESVRQEEYESGNSSSSLKNIINEDLKHNIKPTSLLQIFLAIVGFLYVVITQVNDFNSSITTLEEKVEDQDKTIKSMADKHDRDKEYVETLISDVRNNINTRQQNDNASITAIGERVEQSYTYMDTLDSNVKTLKTYISGVEERAKGNSENIRDLNTEFRIFKIEIDRDENSR